MIATRPAADPEHPTASETMPPSVHADPLPPAPAVAVASASPGRIAQIAALWAGVVLAVLVLVIYGLGPSFQARDQRQLLAEYRAEIEQKANEATGLGGIEVPTKAPASGAPVGIIEIPGLTVQQVAVQGVEPDETAMGPGHVPGTAGLGQPGNSVIVGRNKALGGPFGGLGEAHRGDAILVTTTQGQSIYRVDWVGDKVIQPVVDPIAADQANSDTALSAIPEETGDVDPAAANVLTADSLYGRSVDNRLTLVTSANAIPWNASKATVVVAKLEGKPFAPTPQGSRTDAQTGLTGSSGAWSSLILALLAFSAAAAAGVVLYRRASARSAYLVVAPPMIAFTVLAAESAVLLLPAWT
jgi:sortase A